MSVTSADNRFRKLAEEAWDQSLRVDAQTRANRYAENAVIVEHGVGAHGTVLNGRAELLDWMKMRGRSFPTSHIETKHMVVEGNKAMVVWEWAGTLEGDFLGIVAQHQPFSVTGIALWEYNDEGLIQSETVTWNFYSFMAQLGALGNGPLVEYES